MVVKRRLGLFVWTVLVDGVPTVSCYCLRLLITKYQQNADQLSIFTTTRGVSDAIFVMRYHNCITHACAHLCTKWYKLLQKL